MMDALTLHRLLLDSGVRHEIVHLSSAISSADQLPAVLGLPSRRCVAVRLYQAGGAGEEPGLFAVVVWAGRVPAMGELEKITGQGDIRAAAEWTVNEATGYAARLVAPLALPDTVEVYADEDVVSGLDYNAVVYTATGEPRTALGIRLVDLFVLCPAKPAPLVVNDPVPAQAVPPGEIHTRR
jgi:prolyl-tRNA editing enzyme YbaK/EbsC (Cys-tRNA(Pro) deacylase)